MLKKTFALAAVATVAMTGFAEARDQIRVVGSSTVFPFSTAVAERFGQTGFKTPVVESTGTGGGMKLFCAGVGDQHPDITNASRRIKSSEFKMCQDNGVKDVVEVKIGFDGIVMANAKSAKRFELSLRDIFLGLAQKVPGADGQLIDNPNKTWADVNANLPAIKIEVMGPPPTSGTRDAFAELAMEGGCKTFPSIKAMKKTDKKAYKAVCHTVREDGAYIEAGENDNLIVQKLKANPKAFGIFGFGFLDQNSDTVQGSIVNGQEPTFEAISDGSYPVSRSLFFYVKKAHVGKTAGIAEYLAEFTSEAAAGDEGYLADKGLIPLPDALRSATFKGANNLAALKL